MKRLFYELRFLKPETFLGGVLLCGAMCVAVLAQLLLVGVETE